MPNPEVCLGSESVWALTPAQALHKTSEVGSVYIAPSVLFQMRCECIFIVEVESSPLNLTSPHGPKLLQAVIDACERALAVANTSQYALGRLQRQALEARWDVQMELEAGGLTVRAGGWVHSISQGTNVYCSHIL